MISHRRKIVGADWAGAILLQDFVFQFGRYNMAAMGPPIYVRTGRALTIYRNSLDEGYPAGRK
jgi:hypothetical protein